MPELPEVETVRRSLTTLHGKKIVDLQFSKLAPVETTTPKKIKDTLVGATITTVGRWGKYLLIKTEPSSLVIHLGMTGQLRLVDASQNPTSPLWGSPPFAKGGLGGISHTHMEIRFTDGSLLRYRDSRRFGTISLSQTGNGQENPFLRRLGPDYLDPQLTEAIYVQRCRQHPGLNLKNLLLHQGVAAGLGNIYACEALYRAGLNPRQRVKRTKEESLIRLLLAVREILELGIHHGGTTLRDYLDGLGNRGRMKEFLQVYDRKGLPTLDGRGQVIRIVQGNRSTWYCPAVQK